MPNPGGKGPGGVKESEFKMFMKMYQQKEAKKEGLRERTEREQAE